MKDVLISSAPMRAVVAALLALTLAACSGGSSDPELPDNPQNLDVDGNGILDAADDINGDGVVDDLDEIAYAELQNPEPETDPNLLEGNIPPDCVEKDCESNDSLWSNNTVIAQNRSPQSTYAMGIQRILYCLNSPNSAGMTIQAYADGIFGSATAMDVETYQNDKGLEADGVVGLNTWEQLQIDISLLGDAGDGIHDLWGVTSAREGCDNLAQFAELIAEPKNWQLVSEPGGSFYIPFSAHYADLP